MKAFFSYSNSCDVVSTVYHFHDNPSTGCVFCLEVDGLITRGGGWLYKWGSCKGKFTVP